MTTTPAQPREGALLEAARERRVPRLSIRKLAELAGISEARWRQIENGYSTPRKDYRVPVTAPAETLARMAEAAHATPKELREAGRDDAADAYERLIGAAADAPPLDATKINVEGFEALELAIKGTPPESRELALRIALKAVEAFHQDAASQTKDSKDADA